MPALEPLPRERAGECGATVAVIDDGERFGALAPEWDDLIRDSASISPFLSWEWLHAWWTHLRNGQTLELVTVRAGDRLIGVAPLCGARGRLPWLRQFIFLGLGWAGSDYMDLIVRRGYEHECLDAFADWFRFRGQTLRLDHLRTGAFASALRQRLGSNGWIARPSPSGVCPFARLEGHSWDSYVETLRPSQRTRCRRYLSTLRKKFEVRFERIGTEAQRVEALTALMNFHDQRWTPRGGSTAFQTPELRAFHHEVTARALKAGWLRLYTLRLNEEAAAVTYCFRYGDRFYLYQHGFNARFRQYSVGLVLLELTIGSAIDEGAAEFDMLYGDEPYKALWATETRPLERLDLYPPHLRGRLHRRTVDAERRVRRLARRIFPRKQCDSNVRPAGAVS